MKTQYVPASIQNSGPADVNGFLGAVTEVNSYATGSLTGTAYTLTATPAAVTGGTLSPVAVLPTLNQYLIRARVQLDLVGATFAANQTVALKLRNTTQSADVAGATDTVTLPIVTTYTDTQGMFNIEALYTPVAAGDSVTVFASVSALPSAGSVQVTNCTIFANVLPA